MLSTHVAEAKSLLSAGPDLFLLVVDILFLQRKKLRPVDFSEIVLSLINVVLDQVFYGLSGIVDFNDSFKKRIHRWPCGTGPGWR